MTKTFSIYLDLVRFFAALAVVMAHLSEHFFAGIPLPLAGKDAVTVFFVLSGFVIAYVADTKESDWVDFSISRYTRLGSVFFPALLLGVLLAPVENHAGWQGWQALPHALAAAGVNLVFLGQIWHLDITPPNNNPSWSLNYEACYYLLFALAIFIRGPWRWPLVAVAALAIGPKILILMPPWLAGCALYYWRDKLRLTSAKANALALVSIALYAIYFFSHLNVLIRTALLHIAPRPMGLLQWSNRFAGDYILCLIVLINFSAARHMENGFTRFLLRHASAICRAAGYTLSIYLFHMPLIVIFGAVVGDAHGSHLQGLLVAAMLIPAIVALASVTELQRAAVKAYFMRLAARHKSSEATAEA